MAVQGYLRWIAVGLMALSLAACATAQPSEPHMASKQQSDRDWVYFPAEENAVMQDLAQKILQLCHIPSAKQNEETCLRTKVAPDFDASGMGQEGCQGQRDAWDFLKCIVVGNILVSLHGALTDQGFPALTTADWMAPDPYMNRLMTAVARQIETECRQTSGTPSGLNDCVRTQLLGTLKIPRSSRERCMPVDDERAFSNCLAEAYALTVFRAGLARLNEMPI